MFFGLGEYFEILAVLVKTFYKNKPRKAFVVNKRLQNTRKFPLQIVLFDLLNLQGTHVCNCDS